MLISGPCVTPASVPSPIFIAATFADSFSTNCVVDLVLGVDAVGADAGLAHVAVLRDDGAVDRGVDIGVVEHHERRVAAELEPELLHADGGLLIEDLADLGRAGEADEAHRGMLAQHLADRAANCR